MRKMKDSGIEWIGKIPNDWSIQRFKYVVNSLNKGNGITKDEVFPNGNVECVRYGEIYSKYNHSFQDCFSRTNKEVVSSPQYFSYGDILFAGTGELIEEIGKNIVYLGSNACLAGGDIIVVKHSQNPSFLNYAMSSYYAQYQKSLGKAKLKVVHITASQIGNIRIILPSLPEQKKIADFLDAKCADIDQIRADIEKQIEILTDYKKSIITEAVTKGLDPKAKMKDSCIEWIGKIPEHWDVHPLYYYFGERKHKNVLGEEKNLLSISYGKIIRKNIDSKEGLLPENFNGYNIIEKDDIVMRLTDLQNDKRSLRTGLVKEHGIITSAYVTLKAKRDLNAVYFHYLLHCYDLLKVLYNMGNGVRQGLNYSELSRMLLIEPPISEQKAIATYLDEKCSEIDATIAEKQKQLETLEEYKKSLIFEYVTGKKEVV